MININSSKDRKAISMPAELRDQAQFRLARRAVYFIIALLAAVILWASFAPIEEAAVARGQLVPADSLSEVAHLEGGIVQEVLVSEGDKVRQGQMLLALRPQMAGSDLSQLRARAAGLKLKQERLTALIGDRAPEFGTLGTKHPGIAEQQREAYKESIGEAREERERVRLTVERLSEQIENARKEAESLRNQMAIHSEQTEIREKSFKRGYTSRHMLLQSQAAREETRQRLLALKGRIAEATNKREEAKVKLRVLQAQQRSKWAEQRAEANTELAEVDETLKKYRDRVARLAVDAPVDGIVQSLNYKVPGQVIKPGALVAEIVPAHGGLLAEVELQPRDIGHVRVGNEARLTLSNYDPGIVGPIKGEVLEISPTTVEDKEGRFFYRVRIRLARDTLNARGREFPLLPGMTLQAQIKTGSKTLARYMLKPVFRSMETAFAER